MSNKKNPEVVDAGEIDREEAEAALKVYHRERLAGMWVGNLLREYRECIDPTAHTMIEGKSRYMIA